MREAFVVIGRSIVVALVLLASGGAALAYNVPGSNEAILAPVMRMAATDTMATISGCSGGGDPLAVSNDAHGTQGNARATMGNSAGYASVDVRSNSANFGSGITSSDFDLVLGSLCLARSFDTAQGTLLFGGAVTFEGGSGSTLYNFGTMDYSGFGGALFAAWKPVPETRIYASVGISALDFDVTRSGGAVTGQFDGTRWFAAVGVNHRIDIGNWFMTGNAGVQYVHFDADAYREAGFGFGISAPGLVPAYSFDLFLANVEGRLGYRFGVFEPYLLAGFTYDFDSGSTFPGALALFNLQEAGSSVGYFGVGVNVPLGPTGSLGFEASNAYGADDWQNLQFRGRVVLNF